MFVSLNGAAEAADLYQTLGKAAVNLGNVAATKGGVQGLVIGSIPGAIERTHNNGQSPGAAYASQVAENISAMAGSKLGGGLGSGVLNRVAVGAASKQARGAFKEFEGFATNGDRGSIGGLQAELAELKSINGMTAGIQQYKLLDSAMNGAPPRRLQSTKIRHYDSGPLNPQDEMIGRVPDGRNGFVDNLLGRPSRTRTQAPCGAIDVASPNPRSCFSY